MGSARCVVFPVFFPVLNGDEFARDWLLRHSVSTYLYSREKWLKTAISGRFSRLLPSASDSPFPFTARGPQTLPKFSGEETLVPVRRALRVRIDCAPPLSQHLPTR